MKQGKRTSLTATEWEYLETSAKLQIWKDIMRLFELRIVSLWSFAIY